tara:strand:- start:8995 stop:10620 length:1626 start_codon:yes stop_codon:yes gene_type:complete
MAEKFFLFKRKNPAISGGSLFSDSGKGISVVSIPAKSLAYMAATDSGVTFFFNDASPFEENNLTVDGQSFEKTSVFVSCERGKEAELMENVISFINREGTKSVMKFDATGQENTFGKKTATPVIDARVRSLPVKRSLTGTEAISRDNDPATVVGNTIKGRGINTQIDFFDVKNKPLFDIGAEQLSDSVTDGDAITSGLTSRGTSDSYKSLAYNNVRCSENFNICKTRTLKFSVDNALILQDLVGKVTLTPGSAIKANQTDRASVAILIVRGGSGVTLSFTPTFTYTSDSGSNITSLNVSYGGADLQAGDQFTVVFDSGDINDSVTFTLTGGLFGNSAIVDTAGINFGPDNLAAAVTTAPPQPYAEHTVYMVLVRKNGTLLNPIYSGISSTAATASDPLRSNASPFQSDSKNTDFEFSFATSKDSTLVMNKRFRGPSIENFSEFIREGSQEENPEDNLIVLVIRRDVNNRIKAYDKNGDIVLNQAPTEETSGVLWLQNLGITVPFPSNSPQLEIARFGFTNKDLGEDVCKSIAIQLNDKYSA